MSLSHRLFGFTGSRKISPTTAQLIRRVVYSVSKSSNHIAVGCSLGTDAQVIQAVRSAKALTRLSIYTILNSQAQHGWSGSAVQLVQGARKGGAHVNWRAGWQSSMGGRLPARLAARSTAMVQAVHSHPSGTPGGNVVIGFPSSVCPSQLLPSTTWPGGSGSGTWATLALAAGLGLPVMVHFPQDIQPPQHWGGQWVSVSARPHSPWYQLWRWRSAQLVAIAPQSVTPVFSQAA